MTTTIGNYELVRHLATGGMAEVWIARQSGPGGFDRELAIKRILPHLARETRFVKMFLDEARIASQLHHPNIVQIYELGEAEDEYFIAMEFIRGADLAELLEIAHERGMVFPIKIAVRIMADVLAALDFAHDFRDGTKALNIVHRDVSPHNVLVGDDGIVKLVDFGVAHAVERQTKTETGLVKGKISYMAPEQIEQEPVDRRADVFAAGVLLFELLTGELPFGSDLAAVSSILNDEPADPRELRIEVDDELAKILFRALEKRPQDRFESAAQMAEALEAILRAKDVFVSTKQIAAFKDRLMSGAPLEGYDDVTGPQPRSFAEATTAVAHPRHLLADTDPDVEPPSVDISSDEVPSKAKAGLLAAVVAVIAVAAGAASLMGTGGETRPRVESPPDEEAELNVIELDEEWLYYEEVVMGDEELALLDLEEYVSTLGEEDLATLVRVSYEVGPADLLWPIRSKKMLAAYGLDQPRPIDPGDPRVTALLGLDAEVAQPLPTKTRRAPRKVKRRRKKALGPAPATKTLPTIPPAQPTAPISASVAAPTTAQPPGAAGARGKAKQTAPPVSKKRKTKDDHRIIEKAVPF